MKNLKIALNNISKELDSINEELQTLPEGHLARQRATSYFHVIKKVHIGITKNIPLIQQLCRKRYLLIRKVQLEHNLTATTSDQLDNRTPEELIASLPKAYQTVPIHYFYHPQVDKWQGRQRDTDLYRETAIYTYNGINFRSMSERIIAEQLDKYGLLYRYEPTFNLIQQQVSPDFLVKNPFTNKTIIWEHFGAFNQTKYADDMNDKMDAYLNQGFDPAVDLITTYQYHIRQPERIQKLIEEMMF